MILFVDDDLYHLENDISNLRACGYKVHHASTVDEAVDFIATHRNEIDGVICDIMMPHGEAFTAAETRAGLRAGLKLFEWARKQWPDLLFVIFTNVQYENLRGYFEKEPRCIYMQKQDYWGTKFPEQIKKIIPLPAEDRKN
jgi:CheY-like chemotaxis protein